MNKVKAFRMARTVMKTAFNFTDAEIIQCLTSDPMQAELLYLRAEIADMTDEQLVNLALGWRALL